MKNDSIAAYIRSQRRGFSALSTAESSNIGVSLSLKEKEIINSIRDGQISIQEGLNLYDQIIPKEFWIETYMLYKDINLRMKAALYEEGVRQLENTAGFKQLGTSLWPPCKELIDIIAEHIGCIAYGPKGVQFFVTVPTPAIEETANSDYVNISKIHDFLSPAQKNKYSKGFKVGIIDSGFSKDFCKRNQVSSNYLFNATDDGNVYDSLGHGTFVGQIFIEKGNIDSRSQGLTRGVKFFSIKTLSDGCNGRGKLGVLVKGINIASTQDLDVINMSLGYTFWSIEEDMIYKIIRSIITGVSETTLFFASAGNSGPGYETLEVPAIIPEVIAVAACNINHILSGFSSKASNNRKHASYNQMNLTDFGEKVMLLDGSRLVSINGTSFSSPIAAATCILYMGMYREKYPHLSNREIFDRYKKDITKNPIPIIDSATGLPCGTAEAGIGRFNFKYFYETFFASSNKYDTDTFVNIVIDDRCSYTNIPVSAGAQEGRDFYRCSICGKKVINSHFYGRVMSSYVPPVCPEHLAMVISTYNQELTEKVSLNRLIARNQDQAFRSFIQREYHILEDELIMTGKSLLESMIYADEPIKVNRVLQYPVGRKLIVKKRGNFFRKRKPLYLYLVWDECDLLSIKHLDTSRVYAVNTLNQAFTAQFPPSADMEILGLINDFTVGPYLEFDPMQLPIASDAQLYQLLEQEIEQYCNIDASGVLDIEEIAMIEKKWGRNRLLEMKKSRKVLIYEGPENSQLYISIKKHA